MAPKLKQLASGLQEVLLRYISYFESKPRDFPGGPVVKTPSSHCREHGFNLQAGTKTPHATRCGAQTKQKLKTQIVPIQEKDTTHTHTKINDTALLSPKRLRNQCFKFSDVKLSNKHKAEVTYQNICCQLLSANSAIYKFLKLLKQKCHVPNKSQQQCKTTQEH